MVTFGGEGGGARPAKLAWRMRMQRMRIRRDNQEAKTSYEYGNSIVHSMDIDAPRRPAPQSAGARPGALAAIPARSLRC
eukprot:SAG22_NODE_261_length_13373_cov_17.745472_16_plen_79_part_00